RNSQDARGIAARKKLAGAKAKDEEDEERCLEIVDSRRASSLHGSPELARQIEKGSHHQEHATEKAPVPETHEVAARYQSVKLIQSGDGEKYDQHQKEIIR